MNMLFLGQALKSKGFEIVLFTTENSPVYKNEGGIFESIKILKGSKKYFDFNEARNIAVNLKSENINTLMVFDNRDLDVASWCKKLYYKNLVIIYQQQMQIGINKKSLIHTYRFSSIDCWISPLQYLKNEIKLRTKFPAQKVKVIPVGLNLETFSSRKYSKVEALDLLSIAPKATLLGIIGRISDKKGQLFLVEVVLKLKTLGQAVELLIFGSPTVNDPESLLYYEKIIKKVQDEGLNDVIHLIPHQSDVALFYNSIDVFALASHSETYGMVTVEAMLSKVPIIATKSGGTSEILEYGALGHLYTHGDHDEFCQQFIELKDNAIQTKLLTEKAFEIAMQTYSKDKEAEAIADIIKTR